MFQKDHLRLQVSSFYLYLFVGMISITSISYLTQDSSITLLCTVLIFGLIGAGIFFEKKRIEDQLIIEIDAISENLSQNIHVKFEEDIKKERQKLLHLENVLNERESNLYLREKSLLETKTIQTKENPKKVVLHDQSSETMTRSFDPFSTNLELQKKYQELLLEKAKRSIQEHEVSQRLEDMNLILPKIILDLESMLLQNHEHPLSFMMEEVYHKIKEQISLIQSVTSLFSGEDVQNETSLVILMKETFEFSNKILSVFNQTMGQQALLNQTLEMVSKEAQALWLTSVDGKSIVDQANFLAMSASIESGRFGEQGAGIAAVAKEIGRWADRTTQLFHSMSKSAEQSAHGIEKYKDEFQESLKTGGNSYAAMKKEFDENTLVLQDKLNAFTDMLHQTTQLTNILHNDVDQIALNFDDQNLLKDKIQKTIRPMEKIMSHVKGVLSLMFHKSEPIESTEKVQTSSSDQKIKKENTPRINVIFN